MTAAEAASLEAPALDRPSPREATLDEETRALVFPDAADLPASPPSAVEANFARYFVAGKTVKVLTLSYLMGVKALSFYFEFEVCLFF